MAAKEELGISISSCLHMVSAFLALEPPDVILFFARDFGGGSITETVQSCIWDHCINKAVGFHLSCNQENQEIDKLEQDDNFERKPMEGFQDLKLQGPFLKRFLKKLILEIESSGGVVLDELIEYYASCVIPLKDDDASVGHSRILKTLSFLFPNESSGIMNCPKSRKLEVQLRCSINMLEGDTGCSIWPSSLFLSEFVLSFPELFANKCCFEIGSGVGLVGICLSHVKASKVTLTDGDLSTLANMKANLELNHLLHDETVQCVCLPWESTSDDNLHHFAPDIILGADIIYDPSCLPHLVRVLSALLKRGHDNRTGLGNETGIEGPVAYIASVIRNIDTFNCFLALAQQANLVVTDITEKIKVFDFLPYLRSYDRSSIKIFRIHV